MPDLERPGLVRRVGAVLIDVLVLFEVVLVTVVVSIVTIEVLGLTTGTQTGFVDLGGGAYSTIEDLGTWGSLGLGTALLPKSLGDARLSNLNETPLAGPYGLGIQDFGDGWIGHGGQVIGWESMVKQNPETGAVIVTMVNSSDGRGDVDTAVEPFAAE